VEATAASIVVPEPALSSSALQNVASATVGLDSAACAGEPQFNSTSYNVMLKHTQRLWTAQVDY
jgi:hypothetical protein